jgi:hypothetical protein
LQQVIKAIPRACRYNEVHLGWQPLKDKERRLRARILGELIECVDDHGDSSRFGRGSG